jgi:5-(carboxyamino)imidazole ribonucleotide synthase
MLIAIIGGGQLGQMLALAGIPLGHRFRVLDPASDAPAGRVCELVVGAYDDPEALVRLADGADVVTYEFENVPVSAVRSLAGRVPVLPPPSSLEATQDRLREKDVFARARLAVPAFAAVNSRDELHEALAHTGLPAVVKTRRLGYDGKGQAAIRAPHDVEPAWRALGGAPAIVETFIDLRRELSIVAVRDRHGDCAFYPLAENVHREGILRVTRAPADVEPEVEAEIQGYARRVAEHLDHVGALAIELFDTGDGLLANEMAPRVHNSGHWTIEGAETSQFENHVRAITGMPLGPTDAIGYAAMVNLIGSVPDAAAIAAVSGAHLHLYGKQARPGRKLGHVTVRSASAERTRELTLKVETLSTDHV